MMMKNSAIRFMTKVCSVAFVVLFAIIALGPGNWAPRTGFGFQLDHFLGYLALTSLVCLAWPRPVIVGGALMIGGALLEGLQVFTPNHHADLVAASCGAEGALIAALLAELFIRVRQWTIRRRFEAGGIHTRSPSATGWVPG
jgi:VanZ family protein